MEPPIDDAPAPVMPIEHKHNKLCSEGNCSNGGFNFVILLLAGLRLEALLCESHIATLEMGSQGSYLYARRLETRIPFDAASKYCSEDNCAEHGHDFVKVVVNSGMTGSMEVEVLLCTMHINVLEMDSHGTFEYVRRQRV